MAGINLIKQLEARAKEEQLGADGGAAPESGGSKFKMPSFSMGELQREDYIRLLLIAVGAGLIFGTKFFVKQYTDRITASKQAVIAKIDADISVERAKLSALKELQAEQEAFNKRVEELQKKLALVESVSNNRNLAVRMIDFAVTEMPASIWLTKISVDLGASPKIDLKGKATTMQLVSEYLKRLEGAVFFPTWSLSETESESTPTGSGDSVNRETKRFSINAVPVKP